MNGFQTYEGEIQLILGPMFSGKTTELLRRVNRYRVAEKKCILIKYRNDIRYDGECNVVTHDQIKMPCFSALKLNELNVDWQNYDVIGIDEGQFFTDIVEFCEYMANYGRIVVVAALDGTFQRKPFGKILDLIPLSECVTKLKAICHSCKNDASFTKRIVMDEQIELIGGSDKYEAACRKCILSNKSNIKN